MHLVWVWAATLPTSAPSGPSQETRPHSGLQADCVGMHLVWVLRPHRGRDQCTPEASGHPSIMHQLCADSPTSLNTSVISGCSHCVLPLPWLQKDGQVSTIYGQSTYIHAWYSESIEQLFKIRLHSIHNMYKECLLSVVRYASCRL